jgi:hypothetical protein
MQLMMNKAPAALSKTIGCRVDDGPGVGHKPPMSLTDMDDEDDLEDSVDEDIFYGYGVVAEQSTLP